MRKVVFFLVAVVMTAICSSQIVQKNEKGDYRVIEQGNSTWKNTDIKMEGNAHLFVDSFPSAIAHPGQPVVLWQKNKIIKFKPVFKKLVTIEGMALVYDDSQGVMSLIDLKENPREESSYLILFVLVPIFMMLLSNIFMKKDLRLLRDVSSFIVFFLLFIGIIIVVNFFNSVWYYVVLFAFLSMVTALIVFAKSDDKKTYKVASIIFYISMLVCAIFLFIWH